MKTAVIYARYSSDSQSEQSIEGQLRECQKYAERNDILIVETYIDRAMTGTNDNRVAFQKMLKDSAKHQWEIVLVYKLDRFSRNKYESVIHKKTLRDNGVKIVSAMENIPDSPEGTLMESLLEGFNQYFSEELSQKVKRGLRESWLKGHSTGGRRLYGYDIVEKRFVINEKEAEIVREVFYRYAQGETAETIVKSLTERGIYRPNGMHFDIEYIYFLLHVEKYTGKVNRQGIVYDNIYPQIISDTIWKIVLQKYEENKTVPNRKKDIYNYILTGKLISGTCKHNMIGESGTSRSGKSYYYYVCCDKKKHKAKCDTKPIKKDLIEDMIIYKTVSLFSDKETRRIIANEVFKRHQAEVEDNSNLKMLDKRRKEIIKSSQNIVSAIEQGIITEFTKTRLVELESQLNQVDLDIAKENARSNTFMTVEQIENYFDRKFYKHCENIKARKLIVNTFIKGILLYPEKIIITYYFSEPTEYNRINQHEIKEIEQQSEAAFSLDKCSSTLSFGAPHKRHSKKCLFSVCVEIGVRTD